MSDFSIYSTKSKYYDNSRKLVVGKMKDETVGVAIKEFVRDVFMYSFVRDVTKDVFIFGKWLAS